jgi:phenylalanyl-tRNA synthetase beta chain
MKVSYKWLKNYLDIAFTPEEVAEMLTTIGLEVEGVEASEAVRGGLQGVVVGHVTECSKHPDADKLSVTMVNIGDEQPLQIVCGAPNVAAGLKVLVATIGTTLYPGEEEPFKIKKGKIRGVESHGMICSSAELNLSDDHSGILVLKDDAIPGTPASVYLNLETSTVFEVGLTPNRSDATSHFGVARDLLAFLKINKGFSGELKLPPVHQFYPEKCSFHIDAEVLNLTACQRYSGVTILNVEIKESPAWLKNALLSVGVKPINNIVDITNYVLHDLGQPLHAFDADKISGQKIVVDTLAKDTPFRALDGAERNLYAEDLMICDADRHPLCMAGVYGGAESGVSNSTKNIFLESACFNAKFIRRSSTRHLLRTDAAKIFEKGSDPNMTMFALKRAAILIQQLAGGTISDHMIDIYPKEIHSPEIKLRYHKVRDLIGVQMTKEQIHEILHALDMEIKPVDQESILVLPGTCKHDVLREVDVIEEILRIYGLNQVPVSSSIKSNLMYSSHPDKQAVKELISEFLTSNGYSEMMGLSLVESRYYEGYPGMNPDAFVYINNTSNVHLDIMRPDMMQSGLISVAYNLNRQQNQLKLYEFGKSYLRAGDGFQEEEILTVFRTGKRNQETWSSRDKDDADFFDIKEVASALVKRLDIRGLQMTEEHMQGGLQYGLTFQRGNQPLLHCGAVSRNILKKTGIKQPVFFLQMYLNPVLKAISKNSLKVAEISKFPSVRRDLALLLDKSVNFQSVQQIAMQIDRKILKDVQLFDVYENESQLGSGKKSYAVSFHFESVEKTLQDREVDAIMVKIEQELEGKTGAKVRK